MPANSARVNLQTEMTSPLDKSGEFDLIEALFAPLSAGFEGAFSLTDDAAVFSVREDAELVVTKDAMVAGVHFLPGDKPANIARKLLRTNLSDLAAMGAKPKCYLLAIALNETCDRAWLTEFCAGLAADQAEYGVRLIGGDTVKTPGPLTLSLTLMGEVDRGQSLRRNGAKTGDFLCVSGSIGDAALGLKVATGELRIDDEKAANFLTSRYFLPEPRVELGLALVGVATACLDISDGLLADVAHLCTQSGVGARIDQQAVPLSDPAAAVIRSDPACWDLIMGGGDDYELVFTIDETKLGDIQQIEKTLAVPIYVIGQITAEKEIVVFGRNGEIIPFETKGWTHR